MKKTTNRVKLSLTIIVNAVHSVESNTLLKYYINGKVFND